METASVICLVAAVAICLAPDSSAAALGDVESTASDRTAGLFVQVKPWLRSEVAGRLARDGFREAPLLTWLAGWDFSKRQWRLNEFTNQMIHAWVGGVLNRLVGRPFTLCVALAVEAKQYLGKDEGDLKLLDRTRDVAFYLLL